MRYHFIIIRMAIINKTETCKCWQGCGKMTIFVHCWIKNGSATVSNSLAAPQKLNVGLPNDPVIALLNIYTQKD